MFEVPETIRLKDSRANNLKDFRAKSLKNLGTPTSLEFQNLLGSGFFKIPKSLRLKVSGGGRIH